MNKDYTRLTLGNMLSSANNVVKRHAQGVLKALQETREALKCEYIGKKGDGFGFCGGCGRFHDKKKETRKEKWCYCQTSGLSIPHLVVNGKH